MGLRREGGACGGVVGLGREEEERMMAAMRRLEQQLWRGVALRRSVDGGLGVHLVGVCNWKSESHSFSQPLPFVFSFPLSHLFINVISSDFII